MLQLSLQYDNRTGKLWTTEVLRGSSADSLPSRGCLERKKRGDLGLIPEEPHKEQVK